jgi:hypothetical protein
MGLSGTPAEHAGDAQGGGAHGRGQVRRPEPLTGDGERQRRDGESAVEHRGRDAADAQSRFLVFVARPETCACSMAVRSRTGSVIDKRVNLRSGCARRSSATSVPSRLVFAAFDRRH